MKKKTRPVSIGGITLGNSNPVRVQTMLNTDPENYRKSLNQLKQVTARGAELVRVSVPTQQSVAVFRKLKTKSSVPLIADIHFDWKLAISALSAGADKIRINPGNIGEMDRVKEIINEAAKADAAIRIGVNSGSLPKRVLKKHGHPSPAAMIETMAEHVDFFEQNGFRNIVLSAKSSDPRNTVLVNRMLSDRFDYPIHIGVTEAGPILPGLLKSSLALSELLGEGIGDTIRISLTASPWKEVDASFYLLKFLGLRDKGIDLITCPTCGRTGVDLISIVDKLYRKLPLFSKNLTLALMGCVVNGPGEAREADMGMAFGPQEALYFEKGEPKEKVPAEQAIKYILEKVNNF